MGGLILPRADVVIALLRCDDHREADGETAGLVGDAGDTGHEARGVRSLKSPRRRAGGTVPVLP